MHGGCACDDGEEWVCADNEHNDLGDSGDMMVDEASSLIAVQPFVYGSVYLWHEPLLEDVVSYEEEDDEGDDEDETRIWCQLGNFRVHQHRDMRAPVVMVVMRIEADGVSRDVTWHHDGDDV